MEDQILDEDLTLDTAQKEKSVKNMTLEAFVAVIVAAFIYFFFLLIDVQFFEGTDPIKKAFVNDSLSIIHLLIAMIYINYSTTKGSYKQNVRGGYYILLFGSGLFLIGASISLFEGIMFSLTKEHTLNQFWKFNYQHIITIIVVFIKLALIYPIALILSKIKKYVPTQK